MTIKQLQEALTDAEIVCGNSDGQIFVSCGNESFNISLIRVEHISYAEMALTNQVFFDLTRLVKA